MKAITHLWNTIAPRQLFLVDGLGAMLSALGLGVVLPAFEPAVGLPGRVLYPLAFLAGGLTATSWLCFWANPANWRPWLTGISRANLLYCGVTTVLLLGCARDLTGWGGTYFGLELALTVLLARWELHTATRPSGLLNRTTTREGASTSRVP